MSTLGKILAVLNVLAAAAFVALVGMDWGKRHSWAFAVYVHDLQINGLPVNDKVEDIDQVKQVEKLSKPALDSVYGSLGDRVNTQVDEVVRLRNLLTQQVSEDANDKWAKAKSLAKILDPLATSVARRDGLTRIKAASGDGLLELAGVFPKNVEEELNKKENREPQKHRDIVTAQLELEFRDAFDQVLNKQDPEEQRGAIAALLFNLIGAIDAANAADPFESSAFKRLVAVCGLEAVSREVDAQAGVLRRISLDVPNLTTSEQAEFVVAHRRVLQQILVLEKDYNERRVLLAGQQEKAQKHQEIINTRKLELTEMRNKLDVVLATNKLALTKQGERELELLQALRRLRDMHYENLDLERDIRGLEEVK